ncbi:MAG: hypothetical protein OXH70_05280 [Acidobacteria bacterium]|nr:hypothetical protein [Acidobacteriota bacterium]
METPKTAGQHVFSMAPLGVWLRSGYRKNAYRIDPETIDLVDRNWGFAVKAWDYRPPKQRSTKTKQEDTNP